MGVLGLNAGQTDYVYTVEETMERTREQIRKIKALTDKPFALNVGPLDPESDLFTAPTLELMAEEGVSAALYWGDVIPYWFDKFHEKGIKVIFRAATPTIENTKAAVAAGAAFVLGAEGLLVGTAFLLSEESLVADNIKQAAVRLHADDMMMYRVLPAFYRTMPGELPDKLVAMSKNGASEADIFEAQHKHLGIRNGMLFGDLSNGFASLGLGISLIHDIEPVSVIVNRLMDGIREYL